ncbi:GNAT family N-acetyltransferase [Streptomyces sp. NPDC020965]|uniref:GNAT family N-acetyltransferase n=1 Tax=Streptomyces sp. NPDC020965 TaxID=3365105 RepID=UPI00379FD820
MTTTLRPTGPLQDEANGARSREYEVRVNSRPVGAVEIATLPSLGPGIGTIRSLRIDEPDRRRGRGTVAALAAEEVLRGWGCTQAQVSVPPAATGATRLATALGYTERGRLMLKELDPEPPALPADVEARSMTEAEFRVWWEAELEGYARSWAERGLPADLALAKAEADRNSGLPDGLATPGVRLQVLVRGGAVVGHLYLGWREVRPGERGAYVYDVEVAVAHRGRGNGRSLMLLAERDAREAGTRLLGLHVFAGNAPALALYESLGYRTTAVNLAKPLL